MTKKNFYFLVFFLGLVCAQEVQETKKETKQQTKKEAKNEETPEEKQLNTILASSEREFSFTNKTMVSGQDFMERQVNNLTQMFEKESSISVGGGGTRGQKVYIRGMEDRLLRVRIDGAAQNGNAFHHQGNLLIDATMIKNIELIKGAANASVGPGALAGSMTVTTKSALDFLNPGQKVGFRVETSAYTNYGVKESAAIYGSDRKYFDMLALYNFLDIFYYRNGKHTFTNLFDPTPDDKVLGSPSMQNNGLIKANVYFTSRDKFTFSYSIIHDQAVRPLRSNVTRIDPNLNNGVDFALILFRHRNMANNFSGVFEHKGTDRFSKPNIKFNAYGNLRNVRLTVFSINDPSVRQKDEEGTTPRDLVLNNTGADFEVKHALGNQKKNALEYGINYQNFATADRFVVPTATQRGRENANIIGGYVQANYYVLKNLSIGAGTRYDFYFYYDQNYQHHLTQGFSPSAVILWNPVESMDVKVSYSYVTRGAIPADTLLLGDRTHFIAKNLKAEKGQNVELDIDYHHEYFALRGAAFYQNIKDFINSYGIGHGYILADGESFEYSIKDNLKYPVNIFGFEAGLDFFYENFLASFSFSRSFPKVRGHLINDTYELGAAVGNTYVLKFAYDFKRVGLNISWLSRFVQRLKYTGYDIYNDEFSQVDKPGYMVHNIYFTYIPPRHKNFTLYFAIENLFNAYYISQSSPYKVSADAKASESINAVRRALAEPGLNAKLALVYKF
ncbi:Iron-regulated outer membrane protein FrpB1 [Helicobacter mustelae]|uniref:TonB-dependent receptor domain-containing protein n=1 Tax=Helicobacter mustelae TaxID=217 RepID=UPI000E031BBA|nr:TonB-dependent receptor [Helicobacter mustelae]STP11975.1 Iron-regulated outer membrane protein FrpB1 [Helicobacter mustelae]